ncbi:uncharacterized protein LOC100244373 isoform X2 [Vitis vinifera]|uniref:uncharacterized protein LOC100244373 isoform X2 n=1 Tax=Vitis vinifera TaxID=29760 RepID=UPI0008FEC10D|nr:uncharacterized protein LOC100244373 isoform X2 [Vitis vinifera]|eukprot:XP_019076971.1 PREDICTED: uncharacterized protein LOC100244373 isoform X2 [Vitis vinifera]
MFLAFPSCNSLSCLLHIFYYQFHAFPPPSSSATTTNKKLESLKYSNRRSRAWGSGTATKFSTCYFLGINVTPSTGLTPPHANIAEDAYGSGFMHSLDLAELELDPATAKLAIGFLGPFLSAFAFLFVIRIVMSWYPKLPVGKFPYVIAYAPTEPLLVPTRKLIPPLGGVDVTPVVWFGLLSFLNEILVGPQGLLVLISQQV